ncbi:MAG TPA: hypothetical protein VFD52_08495 [Clostridia bacterium]|nr:hypothetical protein [Clostridia bacterium]
MAEYKYDYNIAGFVDHDLFNKQCKALEKHIPGIEKGEYVKDVDESEIQIYYVNDEKIVVHNSHYIGAIFIKSNVDLDLYF